MKKGTLLSDYSIFLIGFSLILFSCTNNNEELIMSKINVIPKPAKTTLKDGFVDLKQVNEILLASGSEAETAIADIIKGFLSPIKNLSIKTGGGRSPNSLFIKIDSDLFDSLMPMLSASRCLERIADRCTNIAEDVEYFISGEITRHHKS